MKHPKSILITGASSGLGFELAVSYAAPGVRLFLTGRNKSRLSECKQKCTAMGSETEIAIIDVTDQPSMKQWVHDADKKSPLDLVIANAGISIATMAENICEPYDQIEQLFSVNLNGVLNTLLPALETMSARMHGQIAIVSSMASFRGLPGAPAYCASKAAIRVLGEGFHLRAKQYGISISVVCPGFVATPMTAKNSFPMPFLMDVKKATKIIQKGLVMEKSRISFPWQMRLLSWTLGVLPTQLTESIIGYLPYKTVDAHTNPSSQ